MKKDDTKSATDKQQDATSRSSGDEAASPASPDARKARSAEPAGSGAAYSATPDAMSKGAPSGTLDNSDLRPGVAQSPPGRAASAKGSSLPTSGDAASASSASPDSNLLAGADPLASAGSTKAMGGGAQGDVWAAGTSPSAATMGSGHSGLGHDLQRAGDTPGTNPERTGYISPKSYGGVTGGSSRGADESWAAGGGRSEQRQDVGQASEGTMSVSSDESTFSGKEIGGGRDTRAMGSRGAEHAASSRGGLGMEGPGSSTADASARYHDTGETSGLWKRFEENRGDPARWRGNQNMDSSGAMTNSDVTGAQWAHDDQEFPWREGVGRGHINADWSGQGDRSSAASLYSGQGRSEGGWAASGSSFGGSSYSGSSFGEEAKRLTQRGLEQARSSLSGPPREWAMSLIEGQKRTAADSLRNMADAFRATTDRLRQDNHPEAAHYAESAARQVERAADYLFGQDIEEMVHGAQTFARRHPELFVGGALALGFVMARFFRSHGHGHAAYEGRHDREESSWRGQQGGPDYHERGGHRPRPEQRARGFSPDAGRYQGEYGERLSSQPGPDLRDTDVDPSGGASHREMRVMERGERGERGGRGRSY